jgi:hypothetical protein
MAGWCGIAKEARGAPTSCSSASGRCWDPGTLSDNCTMCCRSTASLARGSSHTITKRRDPGSECTAAYAGFLLAVELQRGCLAIGAFDDKSMMQIKRKASPLRAPRRKALGGWCTATVPAPEHSGSGSVPALLAHRSGRGAGGPPWPSAKQRCTHVTVVGGWRKPRSARTIETQWPPTAPSPSQIADVHGWPCHGQHIKMVVNGKSKRKRMQLPACRP